MMSKTRGWAGLRATVIALGLLAWTTSRIEAAAIPNLLDYGTSGTITLSGINGTNVISYVPVTNAEVDPTSNIPLGSFQVAALPTGQTTTYTNTPFEITFIPTSYGGSDLSNSTPVTITGSLNGSLTGDYQSSVNVTINPVSDGSFQIAGASSTLSMLQNDQKLLVPASAGGTTTLEGIISTTGTLEAPVPEPSTIALFLSTVGGLGLRRYVLSRRKAS
jgi:PEP-CTERM motif